MKKIIDLYKKGIDRTLIVQNLRRTPEERLRIHQEMHNFADSIKNAKFIKRASKK